MLYRGTIREIETWDYVWIVKAHNKDEAKEKILKGEGTIDSRKFIEGADCGQDRGEGIRDVHLVIYKGKKDNELG